MAVSIDDLNAITQKKIMPKMYDNIFDSNPLLNRILKSGQYISQDGGVSLDIPLNYAVASASGWYKGAETLNTQDNANISAASYKWKSLYAGIAISEEDKLKNSGSSGVLKLLASKAMIAEKTLRDDLGTGLFSSGSDADSIVGLRDICATDQTVGGLSQSTNSWWQAQVDSTTATLTISALQTQYENASIDNEKPTVGICTRANYSRYYNLLQPQQRFTDSKSADAGFQNLMFNGIGCISESHCPANHWFFLNEKHLHLWYHPERNITAMPFAKPINQEVTVSRILWMGSYGSSNNRLHAVLTGLTA